jgi:O-antigen/teichoic acid export membrane protein
MLEPPNRTRSVLGNTVASVVAQVAGIAVALVLTPYIVDVLGIELFGLWALLSAVVAYARLLMLGVGRGTIRFIAHFAGRGELGVVRSIVSYGVLSHLAVGAVLSPLAWLAAHTLLVHLSISSSLLDTAQKLFPLAFLYVFFTWATRPLAALLIGLERLWVTSAVSTVGQLVYAAVVVTLLSRGVGVYALVAGAFAQTGLESVVYYVAGRRLIGRVFGNPFALRRQLLREMLSFGGWFQVTALANLVNYETDAIVIGSWLGVAPVGLYAIGTRIAQLVRMIPLALLSPLLPAVAALHSQGDEAGIFAAVVRGSRLVGLLTVSTCGFVLATAPLIVEAWLGRSYNHVAFVADVLVIAYAATNLTGVSATVLSAVGRPRYQSHYALVAMGLNILATAALAPFFGLHGVVAGTAFALVVASGWFLWRVHRLMGYAIWRYFGAWMWRLVAATALAAAPVLALRLSLADSVAGRREEGLLALAALGLAYAAVLLATLRLVSFLQAGDLAMLRRALPARLQPLAATRAVQFLFGAPARDKAA